MAVVVLNILSFDKEEEEEEEAVIITEIMEAMDSTVNMGITITTSIIINIAITSQGVVPVVLTQTNTQENTTNLVGIYSVFLI